MYCDPNDALYHWYALFKSVLDSHAPLKKRRVKRLFIPEWFNTEIQGLQAATAARKNWHKKAILENSPSH